MSCSETTKEASRITKKGQETAPRKMKTVQAPKNMNVKKLCEPEKETIVAEAASSKNTEMKRKASSAPKRRKKDTGHSQTQSQHT